MRVAPNEGAELGDGNEARKVEHLGFGVAPRFFEAAKIEELRAVVYFRPEALQNSARAREREE